MLFPPSDHSLGHMTASALTVVNSDGGVSDGARAIDGAAAALHGAFHRAGGKARCLAHLPLTETTALTMMEDGHLAHLTIGGLRYVGEVAYAGPSELASIEPATTGAQVAALMAERYVLITETAGVFAADETIAGTVHHLYNVERAIQVQQLASSTGLPLRAIRPGLTGYDEGRSERRQFQTEQHFAALTRLLDKEDGGYRD